MKRDRQPAKGAIELIEEAVHLLRQSPPGVLAGYYAGAAPFVLGGLYFWADMSRSPFAGQRLAGEALVVGALFLWMKYRQAVFAMHLRSMVAGWPAPFLTLRRRARIFIQQAVLQATGLYLLPLAALFVLPLGWVYAFYQNLTALADQEEPGLAALFKKTAQQTALRPMQNHTLLAIMSGFGFYVFLNWTTVCFGLPGLVKMLFGIETMFTRSALSMLNTTFFAVMAGLTYLSVDPIIKAAYALRCFYGESRLTGEDLAAELRPFAPPVTQAVACVLIMTAATCLGGNPNSECRKPKEIRNSKSESTAGAVLRPPAASGTDPKIQRLTNGVAQVSNLLYRSASSLPACMSFARARAAGGPADWKSAIQQFGNLRYAKHTSAVRVSEFSSASTAMETEQSTGAARNPASPPTLSPAELDHSIQRVIQKRKYTWRAPREKLVEDEGSQEGIISRFLRRIGEMLRRWLNAFVDWLGEWLRKWFRSSGREPAGGSGYRWILLLEVLLYALLAAAVAGLVLLIFRLIRDRRKRESPIASVPIQPMPDLRDESVGAEQLPEDGWTQLGRELLERGELRLALRAFYLAGLAHLAARNLISLARFKSNRDYERELGRRGHSFPALLALFGESISVFDRTWYGMHEVSRDIVAEFAARIERIMAG
jgi:hypothetical protein